MYIGLQMIGNGMENLPSVLQTLEQQGKHIVYYGTLLHNITCDQQFNVAVDVVAGNRYVYVN